MEQKSAAMPYHNERRTKVRSSGDYEELLVLLPHAKSIGHKIQHIIDPKTGNALSAELLIDAPENEIRKHLSQKDVSFDIFLSQLITAFGSGEHRHINVEISDLSRPDFIPRLSVVLANFRRKAERKKIAIEITERGSVHDAFDMNVRRSLAFIKSEGFSLYVDDYDVLGTLSNNVSRIVLERFKSLITGVKIPHEHGDVLLTEGDGMRSRILSAIPPTKAIIVEGMGLLRRREFLPTRIQGIQDPIGGQ